MVNTSGGKHRLHVFTLSTFAAFMMQYFDHPDAPRGEWGARSMLDGASGELLGRRGVRLIEKKDIRLGDYQGRYLKVLDRGTTIRLKFFVAGRRLYMLAVGVDERRAPATAVELYELTAARFLDSFRLSPGPAPE